MALDKTPPEPDPNQDPVATSPFRALVVLAAVLAAGLSLVIFNPSLHLVHGPSPKRLGPSSTVALSVTSTRSLPPASSTTTRSTPLEIVVEPERQGLAIALPSASGPSPRPGHADSTGDDPDRSPPSPGSDAADPTPSPSSPSLNHSRDRQCLTETAADVFGPSPVAVTSALALGANPQPDGPDSRADEYDPDSFELLDLASAGRLDELHSAPPPSPSSPSSPAKGQFGFVPDCGPDVVLDDAHPDVPSPNPGSAPVGHGDSVPRAVVLDAVGVGSSTAPESGAAETASVARDRTRASAALLKPSDDADMIETHDDDVGPRVVPVDGKPSDRGKSLLWPIGARPGPVSPPGDDIHCMLMEADDDHDPSRRLPKAAPGDDRPGPRADPAASTSGTKPVPSSPFGKKSMKLLSWLAAETPQSAGSDGFPFADPAGARYDPALAALLQSKAAACQSQAEALNRPGGLSGDALLHHLTSAEDLVVSWAPVWRLYPEVGLPLFLAGRALQSALQRLHRELCKVHVRLNAYWPRKASHIATCLDQMRPLLDRYGWYKQLVESRVAVPVSASVEFDHRIFGGRAQLSPGDEQYVRYLGLDEPLADGALDGFPVRVLMLPDDGVFRHKCWSIWTCDYIWINGVRFHMDQYRRYRDPPQWAPSLPESN